MRRRKARELALRMLYQMDTNGEDPELALLKYCETFPYNAEITNYTKTLLAAIKRNKRAIDGLIEGASENWRPERLTYVDRNVLRIGIQELVFSTEIPPKVAIDEGIELAKKYGNEFSREFINGILDRVFKDQYNKEASGKK